MTAPNVPPLTPLGMTAQHIEEIVPRRRADQYRFQSVPYGAEILRTRNYSLRYVRFRPAEWFEAEYPTEMVRWGELIVVYQWSDEMGEVELQEMIAEDHDDICRAIHHRQLDWGTTDLWGRSTWGEATVTEDDEAQRSYLVMPLEMTIYRG